MWYHLLDVLVSLDMLIVDQRGPKLTKMDPSGYELTKINLRGPNGLKWTQRDPLAVISLISRRNYGEGGQGQMRNYGEGVRVKPPRRNFAFDSDPLAFD